MGMEKGCGDAQLGCQSNVNKTHIGPRVDKYLERLGLVAPPQDGTERGASKRRRNMNFTTHQRCTHSKE
jgi:hypothetical protein